MSLLCPTIPSRSALRAGDYAELALLDTLERGLSDAYTLFHNVDWTRANDAMEQHGEIDIVVVNQSGDVLLMEVKSGNVEFTPEGIFKAYGGQKKSVTAQVDLQYSALRGRLQDAGIPVRLSHLLVLPDYRVLTQTVQWPRDRIVDSDDITRIVSRISDLLGPGLPNMGVQQRVLAFFQNRFQVELDVSALTGRVQQQATRLSAGLATWVPRVTSPSGLIRVEGTAGSGKTQLALRLLRDADLSGHKAAYICYNRALADHLSRLAPVRTPVVTFHELASNMVRHSGQVVDFTLPDAFDDLARQCMALLQEAEPDLDLLVLDESQDMQPEWVQAMLSRLKNSGKAVLLEDAEQKLYKDRVAFDLPDAVTITSHENFRTPRALVELINLLQLTSVGVEALSPHVGDLPDPIVYSSHSEIARSTIQAVDRCLSRGFELNDIAIVSMRGRERSVLQGFDTLGAWKLRRFTGRYDEGSNAIWTKGDLLIESVRRFKGQSAPAVVLTECDFREMDTLTRRLLFVGLTRARVHLEWVMDTNAATLLESLLKS